MDLGLLSIYLQQACRMSSCHCTAGKTISDGYQLLVDKQGVNDQRYFLAKKWSSR